MKTAIKVADVKKAYGNTKAVDGISLEIEQGEFFGIIGPNGAGKTTLLEIIEGLREADSGQVELLGAKPWPRNKALLPRIGVQLQASAFFEKLTAREQLDSFADLYNAPRRTDEMLELVGLTEKAKTPDDKLSGGQKQRLNIACALVHDPEVVFLDEPTAALDPQARRNLWDVLRNIQEQGKTIVLTTHYLDEAEILCDRIAVVDKGKVLALDAPANLVRGLEAPTKISLPSGAISADEANQIGAVETASDDGVSVTLVTRDSAGVLTELSNRNLLHGISVHSATLEDVFLSLTGREYRA